MCIKAIRQWLDSKRQTFKNVRDTSTKLPYLKPADPETDPAATVGRLGRHLPDPAHFSLNDAFWYENLDKWVGTLPISREFEDLNLAEIAALARSIPVADLRNYAIRLRADHVAAPPRRYGITTLP